MTPRPREPEVDPSPRRAPTWSLTSGHWRESLLTLALRITAVLGAIVCIPSVYLALEQGLLFVAVADTLALIGVVALLVTRKLSFERRALCFASICYLLGVVLLTTVGPVSQVYLLGYSLLVTLLLGQRAGLVSVALNCVTLLAIGTLQAAAPQMSIPGWGGGFGEWIVISLNFLLINALLALALGSVIAALETALEQGNMARAALELEIDGHGQAVAALQTSEERFRMLSRATNDAIWDWDLRTNALWWNEGFVALFGHQRDEVEPTIESWTNRIHPDEREAVVADVQGVIRGGGDAWVGEYRYLRKDGAYAYVLDRGHIIRADDGQPLRMVGGMTDLSERKATELRLAEQAALIDEASDAILVRDLENRVLFWNRRAEELYGWTKQEVSGRCVSELMYDDPAPLLEATSVVLEHGEWSGELEHRTRDGTIVTVLGRWTLLRDASGAPRSILAIHANITERKRFEAHVLRNQRMESIGTLASGIAHDLNNILSPILVATDMLKERTDDPDAHSLIDTLHGSAQRGADLVRQILGTTRGMEGDRVPLRPQEVAEDVGRIVQDTFPRSIEFRLEVLDDLWRVQADPTQLYQVLMNLCVNARDAMPDGGRLTVALRNVVLDEVFAGMHAESKPGPYVVIRVEDSGTGMSKELQQKIFEPFFTTKELGRGTGLGLPTTFTIVKNHGGFINLYSEPGKGTKFKVYLPATTAPAAALEVPITPTRLPCGRGELILLVDDEENIREITRRALERFGYRVLLAVHGAEAVSLYAQYGREIAAILTDMSMPVMDGPAMIVAVKTLDPAVRIIGSSGLAANDDVARAKAAGVQHFIPKPYTAEALLTALSKLLHADAAPPAEDSSPASAPDSAPGSAAKILLVDDDAAVAQLCERILADAGYEVTYASNGEEALALFDQEGVAFDVVVTDLQMPRLGGEALYHAAADRFPTLGFIFMSGIGALPASLSELAAPKVQMLSKPYSPRALEDAVRRALRR